MIKFSLPVIDDAKWAVPLICESESFGCDTSFANSFLWQKKYNIKIGRFENFVMRCYGPENETSYAFPTGYGNIKAAVDALIKDAEESGHAPVIGGITDNAKEFLEETYPEKFTFEASRDSFDYIYKQESLANLAGKKYQKKRNHISRFLRTYKNYSFEKITEHNAGDALKVARGWCSLHGVCTGGEGLDDEFCAIRAAFNNYEALELFGGILYIENEPAAMTVGSKINKRICDTHFEKALEYEGAYAMINREFARTLDKFQYINREEDMGLEGLRKAKLSYHPDILLTKYTARAVK